MKYLKSFEELNSTFSPDKIPFLGLKSTDDDALSFQYDNDKQEWLFSEFGENHYFGIYKKYKSKKFSYNGRLWINSKIIIFWHYPYQDNFDEFIYILERKLDEKIWNNDWKIIIPKELKEYSNYGNDAIFRNDTQETFIIPIEKYYDPGEEFPEELYNDHLKKQQEKEIEKQNKIKSGKEVFTKGWGSKNAKNDIKYRYAIGENKNPL